MPQLLESPNIVGDFIDRRSHESIGGPVRERRQFVNNHDGLSPDAKELADSIDAYKVRHRRRFITYEEVLQIVQGLGYRK